MLTIPETRRLKIVRRNKFNKDEYLLGFYPDKKSATEDASVLSDMLPFLKGDCILKSTNPELIIRPVETDYNHLISAIIPEEDMSRVMASDASAEITRDCITCGSRTYYNLARLIDKRWTVIDIGCSYNAQSYLFQDHAGYIGVNPRMDVQGFHFERFQAPGTQFYETSGQRFIKEVLPTLGLDLDCVFAICHFVPDRDCTELVRKTFKNVFTYYPASPKIR